MECRHFNVICAVAIAALFSSEVWAQQTNNGDLVASNAMPDAPAASAVEESRQSKNRDQISTVIVTANKRNEDASKIPTSISVLGGEELASQHINSFADATRSIPNFSFGSAGGGGNAGDGPGLSNIELRGISSDAGSSTVGVYFDDVSMTLKNIYSMGSPEPKFFDLDHIEVLRGPQGTLYGASSMGGTVKFISNQPNLAEQGTDVAADVSSTKGGGINHTESAVFNIVLTPGEMALRLGIQSAHTSGYINQVSPTTGATVASGINSENDAVVHMALKWAVNKELTVTPAVFYQKVATDDIAVSYTQLADGTPLPINETTKSVREPGVDKLLVPSLTVNYDMGKIDLTSVTSYFKREFDRTADGTTTNSQAIGNYLITDAALGAVVATLPSPVYFTNTVHQISQELRIASKAYDPSVSPVTWVAGVYASDLKINLFDNEYVPGINAAFSAANLSPSDPSIVIGAITAGFPNDNVYAANYDYHDTQQSIFGEENYYFSPTLHATAGIRYLRATEDFHRFASNYFNSDGSNNGYSDTTQTSSGTKVTPKFALTWEATPSNTLYATAAEGFRNGGANAPLPMNLCQLSSPTPTSYQSDSLWSYELGSKSRFLDNHLSVNAALFYINWNKLQETIIPNEVCGYQYIANVGAATSYGAEVEAKFKPAAGLVFDLSGGLTHATLSDNTGQNDGVIGAVKGVDIPGVPKFNALLTGQYNFTLTDELYSFVRADAHWTGSSHGVFNPINEIDGSQNPDYNRAAYSTVDLSTGLSVGKWDFSLYVKNLANNQKVIQSPHVQAIEGEVYRITPRIIGISMSGKL